MKGDNCVIEIIRMYMVKIELPVALKVYATILHKKLVCARIKYKFKEKKRFLIGARPSDCIDRRNFIDNARITIYVLRTK